MLDGLLHRVIQKSPGKEVKQLVLPKKYQPMVLRSLHDESGHLGVERTINLVKARFYWPKMNAEIEQYINSCGRCISRKSLPQKSSLNQITSNGPLDLVCIDFLSLESDSKGIANVLVVTDHFTRYAQAFPTKDQKANTVAKVLHEKYFVHYGLPVRIHSHQGTDFGSRLIKELLSMLGVRKFRTTPYHPQVNAQPERLNRTFLAMLGTLDPSKKQKWSQYISHLVHAYNCKTSDATLLPNVRPGSSFSGWHLFWYLNRWWKWDPVSEIHQWNEKRLKKAYELASDVASKSHLKNKTQYDQRVWNQALEKGDRVLIRNVGFRGKHKLQDRWRAVPFVIIEKLTNLQTYQCNIYCIYFTATF